MSGFTLHPQLASDTLLLGKLAMCRVLLMNNEHFPWIILVPECPGVTEVFELDEPDALRLWTELRTASLAMKQAFAARKINMAAIGNRVPQLHIHIIARQEDDATWPGVVWDKGPAQPMSDATRTSRIAALQQHLRFSVVP
jgi:diadenosine tetraphosphate (Ap4A) HIT family hydrolase